MGIYISIDICWGFMYNILVYMTNLNRKEENHEI